MGTKRYTDGLSVRKSINCLLHSVLRRVGGRVRIEGLGRIKI